MSATPLDALQKLAAEAVATPGTNGTEPRPIAVQGGKARNKADEAWARAALAAEIATLRATDATSQRRNIQLNLSAFQLGQLIPHYLDSLEVERELESAARATGLPDGEIKKTMQSGLEAGMKEPRYRPQQQGTPHVSNEKSKHNNPPAGDNSAGTTGTSADRNQEVFTTARAVAESTPEIADWLAYRWLAKGAVTEIDGKLKFGKTTWTLAICRAVLDGAAFMGSWTRRSPVVYLTEQPMRSFREGLRRADLLERDDFHILPWSKVTHLNWQQKVGIAVEKAQEVGAEVLIVDTLAWWAGLRGDDENSTGAAQAAMEPIVAAASVHGLAVAVLRHERKSGGDVGDSGRGASAFGGAVDIVLAVKKPEGNPGANPNMRVVTSLSRFDETPAELMIELTDGGFVEHGDMQAVARAAARQTVTAILKTGPSGPETGGLTMKQLEEACKEKNVHRTTLQEVLNELVKVDHVVSKTGEGKPRKPYFYNWIGPAD